MVTRLGDGNPGIVTDPCNRRATQRNWGEVRSQLRDIVNKVNEVVDILNVTNINDIDIVINEIINNNTFITNVNNYIFQTINNYFSNLASDIIEFQLLADLDYDIATDTWRAQATVLRSWLGSPAAATVYVQDPHGQWRWTALGGAKGMAVRAAEDGLLYSIYAVESIAEIIIFRAKYAFAKVAAAFEVDTVGTIHHTAQNPLATFGSEMWIANVPSNEAGGYIFEGDAGDYGLAALIYNAEKPVDSISDPVYTCFQMECP